MAPAALRVTNSFVTNRAINNVTANNSGTVDVASGATFVVNGNINLAGTGTFTKTGLGNLVIGGLNATNASPNFANNGGGALVTTFNNAFNSGYSATSLVLPGVENNTTSALTINSSAAAVVPATTTFAINSNVLTVSSNAGLVVGQTVTGTGLQTGTVITSINGTTITVSLAATVASAGTYNFGANTMNVTSNAGLVVGQAVVGTGIPVGAYITQLIGGSGGTSFLTSLAPASVLGSVPSTIGGNSITSVASTNGLWQGMNVTGTNVAANTTIAAVSGNTVYVISSSSTTPLAASGTQNITFVATGNITNTSNVVTGINTAGLAVGMSVPAVTGLVASVITAIGTNSITLNNAATATTTGLALTFGSQVAQTLALNGGTFQLGAANLGSNIVSVETGSMSANFGSGGHLALLNTAGASTEWQIANLNRTGQGTLVIETGSNVLGQAGNGGSRLIVMTNILGGAAASSVINGIIAPSIVTAGTNGVANFVTYPVNGVNGIQPYTGATVAAFTGTGATQQTQIGAFTGGAVTGTNDIYALSTSGSLTGGTVRFVSPTAAGGTNEGGLLINGAGGAAPVISSNLTFGNLTLGNNGAPGTAAPSLGEGLVYVSGGYTGGASAQISGVVSAANFTKFGPGNLTLTSAANAFEQTFTVQQGTVKFTTPGAAPLAGNLNLNDTAVLDIGTGTIIGGLGGNGGLISNVTGTGASALSLAGFQNTTFSGVISDGTGTAITQLIKLGAGTLTLGIQTAASTNANINTFTGGTVLYNGSLIVQNPFGLGGGTVTGGSVGTPAGGTTGTVGGTPVALGAAGATYAATGLVNLFGGTLNLQSNAGGVNGTVIFGNPNTNGLNVQVSSNATINVDRVGANTGNAIQIGNLSIGNATLSETGGSSYRLRVAGTTTLQGSAAIFSPTTAAPVAMELAGLVTDGGAGFGLTKAGAGTLIVSGSANTFTGGVAVLAGQLQVTSIGGTSPLGAASGVNVVVDPGASLRFTDPSSLNGVSSLKVFSSINGLGSLTLDNSFNATAYTANFSSNYGGVISLATPVFSNSVSLAARELFLGAGGGGAGTTEFIGNITAAGPSGTLGVANLLSPTGSAGSCNRDQNWPGGKQRQHRKNYCST